MSSGGTQSPPLEATGEHIPMGVSSIDGSCSKPMKDVDQRAGAFLSFPISQRSVHTIRIL
ncbi:hypothetical protein BJ138DRAFT_1161245 [Hygrophoropsis aurantiaca]|uniref:Uncharacterized protein n=1 Tax=Hygrophoropsis aurantiaca TaxID=72124 RepID=A0ACB8A2Y7_9AGAM|nr:hypothetical protein BJ138DRAFT_1161245 [Hygrophoropsis aurantiaca]